MALVHGIPSGIGYASKAKSFLQFLHVHRSSIGKEPLGAHTVKGDLQQHISAHSRGSQDHTLAKGLMLDHIALAQLQSGRLCRRRGGRQAAFLALLDLSLPCRSLSTDRPGSTVAAVARLTVGRPFRPRYGTRSGLALFMPRYIRRYRMGRSLDSYGGGSYLLDRL